MTEPEPENAAPGDASPIFESVRSGYLDAFGRDPLRISEQRAGEAPAAQPAMPPASWGDGNGRAMAGPPAARRPASSGLPQHLPPSGPVRIAAVAQKTRQVAAAE